MKRRPFALVFAAVAMGVLILDSKNAVQAAAAGVDICIKTVIPSLFPFFVLSIFLTGALADAPFLQPVCRLFQAKEGSEGVLISGLLGGYPVGAQAAAEAWSKGRVSKQNANRLLMFCSQAGPSFLFGMIAAQFPDTKYGWMLWAVQLLSAWSASRLTVVQNEQHTNSQEIRHITINEAIRKAIFAMASVCGWVIVFRVFLFFLDRWVLFVFPEPIRILITGTFELTNGCLALSGIQNVSTRFLCGAVMLNFGGICVLMQTASVAQGLDLGCYIRGKVLQTVLALCFSLCFLGNLTGLIPIAGIFLLFRWGNLRKNSSNPAVVGV